MGYRLKAAIQQVVALLPNGLANTAYYFLQRRFGRLREIDPLPYFQNALTLIRAAGPANCIDGRVVFEVGTGRTANIPLAFWLAGAKRVITFDLNRYLRPELMLESIHACRPRLIEIVQLFKNNGVPLHQDRLQALIACESASSVLTLAGIEYHAPADAAGTGLADASIDWHVSVNVLEHIPPQILIAILTEARRILRPDGLLIHQVDPSDHFAHTDHSLHAVNFLRYSESQWKRIAGNQFMYQNRLRFPEYLRMVDETGFRITASETEIDGPALSQLNKGFPVHVDFRHYAPEDLAVTKLIFSAKRM